MRRPRAASFAAATKGNLLYRLVAVINPTPRSHSQASPLGWAKHQLAGTALWLDYGIVALKAAFTSPHRRHVGDGGRAPPATVVDSGGVAHILPPPILRPPTGGGLPLGAPLLLCLGAATAAYGGWGLHRDVIECLATRLVACMWFSLQLARGWGYDYRLVARVVGVA